MVTKYDHLVEEELFSSGTSMCAGCSGGTLWQNVLKVLGDNVIASLGATCITYPHGLFPASINIPSLYIAMAPAAAGISGIRAALNVLERKGRIKPRDGKTTVFAVSGDGSSADIGFASLSGAAERNDDGIYITFDNEAFMNTGIQRSSSTPAASWTTSTITGKPQPKKDLPLIMAAHNIPYVATATVGFPDDLMKKLKKAKDMEPGFKYLHVYSPCTTGWRYPERETLEKARLAVETGIWVLYEVEHGKLRISYRPTKRKPVKEYIEGQERFAHLTPEDIEAIQRSVDEKCRAFGL